MSMRVSEKWPWPPPMTVDTTDVDMKNAVDTACITDIYLKRPQAQIAVGLGAWFNTAMGLKDPVLGRMEGQEAKKYILNAGYNSLPHLHQRLTAFNQFNEN